MKLRLLASIARALGIQFKVDAHRDAARRNEALRRDAEASAKAISPLRQLSAARHGVCPECYETGLARYFANALRWVFQVVHGRQHKVIEKPTR